MIFKPPYESIYEKSIPVYREIIKKHISSYRDPAIVGLSAAVVTVHGFGHKSVALLTWVGRAIDENDGALTCRSDNQHAECAFQIMDSEEALTCLLLGGVVC